MIVSHISRLSILCRKGFSDKDMLIKKLNGLSSTIIKSLRKISLRFLENIADKKLFKIYLKTCQQWKYPFLILCLLCRTDRLCYLDLLLYNGYKVSLNWKICNLERNSRALPKIFLNVLEVSKTCSNWKNSWKELLLVNMKQLF